MGSQNVIFGGAGGNRTPVHQASSASATTIPGSGAHATPSAGRLPRGAACRLSGKPAVFPAVSGLSLRHPPLLLTGCGGSAPCGIAAHDVSRTPLSGGESELLVGNSLVAPFYESEQLGSHPRTTDLLSKPVSPVIGCGEEQCRGGVGDCCPRPAFCSRCNRGAIGIIPGGPKTLVALVRTPAGSPRGMPTRFRSRG